LVVRCPNVRPTYNRTRVEAQSSHAAVPYWPSPRRPSVQVAHIANADCPLRRRRIFPSVSTNPIVQHIGQPRRHTRPSGISSSAPQNMGANHTASANNENPAMPRTRCSASERLANIDPPYP
jgi:hypothetical protein